MIDHGLNSSQILHFVLFIGAMLLYRRIPAWVYCAAAALLIELDQARDWAPDGQPWLWFTLLDTWFDLVADAAAIWLVHRLDKRRKERS